jgi:hypothetical protein
VFCEQCGLQFLPMQSVCTRCGVTSTRHWFQLMSLVTVMIAVASNTLVAWLLLPRLPAGYQGRLAIRTWYWMDMKAAAFGWVPIGLGLLVWDYFFWQESRPLMKERIKGWIVRLLLVIALVSGLAVSFPRWIRMPVAFAAAIAKVPRFPGVSVAPSMLPWVLIALAAALVCINSDTRDSLLGHGRVLSSVSLGLLLLVLTMTLVVFAL